MSNDGFAKYQAFYQRPPAIVVEWNDRETAATGWLCIDSLHNGAAGGGTRMRTGGTREEAVFLAKTMAVKFQVCGPNIGGGKSVIRFDANSAPDVKRGVLERWYKHIGPYLKTCYGTGGDVGVDEVSEATAITERVLGLKHVQEGIARGHTWSDSEGPAPKIDRLKHGVEELVVLPDLPGPRKGKSGEPAWMIADVITGYGVARSIETYCKHRSISLGGKRVVVEGYGAVGAFAAYYLEKMGAITVATSTRNPDGTIRVAAKPTGLDCRALITAREGTNLPRAGTFDATITDTPSGDELLAHKADIFVPAAASHTMTAQRIQMMKRAGISIVSCGANNPFAYNPRNTHLAAWVADMLDLQREADQLFTIIPDFVANCGMARTFGYLMAAGAKTDATSIINDSGNAIDKAIEKLINGYDKPTGLLNRGYEVFVPA